MTVLLGKKEIYQDMDELLQKLCLCSIKCEDILDIIEGYIGEEYGKATDEVLSKYTN